jgi:hypothetical protein
MIFFLLSWDLNLGPVLAQQVLYHLNYSASPQYMILLHFKKFCSRIHLGRFQFGAITSDMSHDGHVNSGLCTGGTVRERMCMCAFTLVSNVSHISIALGAEAEDCDSRPS